MSSVYYQFEITDWHINCQSIEVNFLSLRSDNINISLTCLTAQDMIIKGTLIAKDIDIKVAISV